MSPSLTRVLLVDDDIAVREALGQTLELDDLDPTLAGSVIEAKDHIAPDFAGIVVSDIRMPGKDGFALLDYAQSVDPDLPVILLTGEGDVPMAVRGIGAGAFDFLEKPCAPKDFLATVERALKARALVLENRALRHELTQGDAAARMLFGRSRAAESLRQQVRTAARTGADVLVSGASGSGTAKAAEVVHLLAAGASAPFIKRSAAAIDPDGVAQALEAASGGTLFLDEVASLGSQAQLALLDHLDAVSQGPRARVVSGTYRDLSAEVATGRFQPDLHLRLSVMQVRIPALSERPEDIPVLFRHYVAQACEQANLPEPDIPPEMNAHLMAQDWPGNARALMNAAMRFALGVRDEVAPDQDLGLAEQMAQVERALLIASLERHDGRASTAAAALKLPRKTLYDKLARHGLKPEDYRA